MSFDHTTLITDRTDADIDSDELRGSYDFRALNRVTAAMKDLESRLEAMGYVTGYNPVNIKHLDGTISTVWDEHDEDIRSPQLEAYRSNIKALRNSIAMLLNTPEIPQSMELLDYIKANNIEQILVDIDVLIQSMRQSRLYAGQPLLFGGFAVYVKKADVMLQTSDGLDFYSSDNLPVYLES